MSKLPDLSVSQLLRDVMQSHRDKDSCDYNECEKSPCYWCDCAEKALANLDDWHPASDPPMDKDFEPTGYVLLWHDLETEKTIDLSDKNSLNYFDWSHWKRILTPPKQ